MATTNFAPTLPEDDDGQTTRDLPTTPRIPIVTSPAPANDNDRDDDDGSGGWGLLALLCVVSIGVHIGLVAGIGQGNRGVGARPPRRPAQVTMTVQPPKPAPPPPAAKAPEPKAAPRRLAVKAAPRAVEAAPPPPAQAETPADFSGVTLTNDGPGPGWASAVGNGQAMKGPIGTPGAKVTGRSVAGSDGAGTAPPVVSLGSLSRPPVPPDLNGALERHYPAEARRQGTPGQAVLKARVLPDGHVRDLVLISQSAPGFGDACRATLRESLWSAPLDKDGQAVATFVTYTCRFEVK
jgi:outer membrane biosynthesis protein TonB